MSVHAGSILHVGGNNVIDRIQSAGLGDTRVPMEVIREVGNMLIVDKVPGEPEFTFNLESLDVSTDLMALLTGKTGARQGAETATGTGDTAIGSRDITNLTTTTGAFAEGDWISGPGIPSDTQIESVGATTLRITQAATAAAAGVALTTTLGSGDPPGSGDPANVGGAGEYKWSHARSINICSPWKDPVGDPPEGHIVAGHLIPGYYPTRLRYRFGVGDNATQEVELAGGAFYYAKGTPVEDIAAGTGVAVAFQTSEEAIAHRKGGSGGTSFRHVFGVMVDTKMMIEGIDYTVSGGAAADPWTKPTVTFAIAPPAGSIIRIAYFTDASHDYPQGVHASTVVKPGAVRGRNIEVYLGSGGTRQRLGGVQTYEQESTVDGTMERELGTEEPTGRQVNGFDTNGTITYRGRDQDSFFGLLSKVTGVSVDEVTGFLNQNTIPLEVAIKDPRNPANTLKTIYVDDAIFQIPGTPARVNQPTDFAFRFESQSGDFSEFKGSKP